MVYILYIVIELIFINQDIVSQYFNNLVFYKLISTKL